jgi:GntR family transcriptional regulator, transcriptional repressor for pyruvate dehydrogenase complex
MLNKKRNILQIDKRPSLFKEEYSTLNHSQSQPGTGDPNYYDVHLVDPMDKSELVVNELVEYISKQGFRPDQKLPSEKELCKIIGVGNRTIREALYCLKGIGIVKSQQGTGWYIKEFDPSSSLKFLSPLLKSFGGTDLLQILQIRLIFEPMVSRLASKYITQRGLDHLKHTLEMMRQIQDGPGTDMFWRYDREFHNILAREGGNNMLAMISSMLTGIFHAATWTTVDADKAFIIQEHQDIYDAVKNKDGEWAGKLTEKHIERAIDAIKGHKS